MRRKWRGAHPSNWKEGARKVPRSIVVVRWFLPSKSNSDSRKKPQFLERLFYSLLRRRLRSNERQSIGKLKQAHTRHRKLDRSGTCFHKVDLHQVLVSPMETSRCGKISVQGRARQLGKLAGDLVRNDGNDSVPP